MTRHFLILALMLYASVEALAAEEIRVFLESSNGQKRVIEGSRPEILSLAGQFEQSSSYHFAIECYKALLEYDSSDVRSRILLGQLYQFKTDDFAKAITQYKKAERYIPESDRDQKVYVLRLSAEAYRELAEKKSSLVYYAQAISEYERILNYQPDNGEIRYYLGVSSLNSRDYDRAIDAFERVIKEEPEGEWAKESRAAMRLAKSERRSRR